MATVVEGNQKAPFSIASTLRCKGGRYSFSWISPFYPWYVPYIAGIEPRSPGSLANIIPTNSSKSGENGFLGLSCDCSWAKKTHSSSKGDIYFLPTGATLTFMRIYHSYSRNIIYFQNKGIWFSSHTKEFGLYFDSTRMKNKFLVICIFWLISWKQNFF